MKRTTKQDLAQRITSDRGLHYRQLLRLTVPELWDRLASMSMTSEQRQLTAARMHAKARNNMAARGMVQQNGEVAQFVPEVN